MNLDKVKDLLDELVELEDYDYIEGDLMSLKEFIKCTEDHSIMDYDGFGDILLNGKEIRNAILWVDEQLISFSDNNNAIAFNLYLIENIYGNDIQICWYNR